MAKLIHSTSLSNILDSVLYNKTNKTYLGEALSGIIFTNDGYIIARGHPYYVGTAIPGNPAEGSGIALSEDGTTLEIYDANGNKLNRTLVLPVHKLISGNFITVSNSSGQWTINHNEKSISGGTSVGPTQDNSDSINVPYFSYDSYGHIVGTPNTVTATLNKVKSEVLNEATNTLYILGHTQAGTATTKYDTSVYLTKTTGTNGTVTLTVPSLSVVNGGSGVTLGSQTLAEYIADRITANDAMVFKGTIGTSATVSALPLTTAKVGWTYKAKTAGWIKTDGTFTTTKPSSNIWQVVEVGDMVMCVVEGQTTTTSVNDTNWTIVLVNIDGLVITNNNLTTNGIVYATGNNTITTTGVGTAGQYLKSTGNGAPTWDTFKSLSLFGQTYEPYNTSLTITCGKGIELDTNKVLGHSNSVTSVTTAGLYKITYDAYGHITSNTTSWTPNNLTFSAVKDSYNGNVLSTAPIFNVDGTGNVTTFAAERGLVLYGSATGITIGHSNPDIEELKTFTLKKFTYDVHGHITGSSDISNLTFGAINSSGVAKLASGLTAHPTYNPNAAKLFLLKEGSNITITQSVNNNTYTYEISSVNTWRDIRYYAISSGSLDNTIDNYYPTNAMEPATAGTRPLKFSANFTFNTNDELDLVWAEVDSNGNITYEI